MRLMRYLTFKSSENFVAHSKKFMINSTFYCPILNIMFKFTWVTVNARRSNTPA